MAAARRGARRGVNSVLLHGTRMIRAGVATIKLGAHSSALPPDEGLLASSSELLAGLVRL